MTNRRVGVTVRGQRLILLPHAIQRYQERACRHDDYPLVIDDLLRLLRAHATMQAPAPSWVMPSSLSASTDLWLLLGDDIAFPLERANSGVLAAMTCVCRAGVGGHRRANRAKRPGKSAIDIDPVNRRGRREQRAPTLEEEAA